MVLGRGLGFWDLDLFGSLEMELGNSAVNFGIVELGRLDKWMHHSDKLEDIWDD